VPDVGHFDVAIIGAGVVGCAVARRFALAGARVAVLEKGADILSGASKANSAILHTGFDAPPGSLELDLIRAGREEYLSIRQRLNLPWNWTSSAPDARNICPSASASICRFSTPVRWSAPGMTNRPDNSTPFSPRHGATELTPSPCTTGNRRAR